MNAVLEILLIFLIIFLKELKRTQKLVTFDITNMYTNINNDLEIEAIMFWLQEDPNALAKRIPKEFIIEDLKLVIENNTFFYNGRYYLQIHGVALGQKCAQVFTTLVIAYLENKLHKKAEELYGHRNGQYIKQNWKQFLDDCFLPWKTTMDPVEEFRENILNTLDKGLTFTMKSQIPS